MKIYIEPDNDDLLSSFSYAKAFYDLCKNGFVDVETVAKMMLLEVENERKGMMGNTMSNVYCDGKEETNA